LNFKANMLASSFAVPFHSTRNPGYKYSQNYNKDPMKKIAMLLPFVALFLGGGCATTNQIVLDSIKRAPTTSVDVFKNKELPNRSYKIIAELSYLGPREDELKAQTRFMNDAKKMGGNGIIFYEIYGGVKGGGTIFQSTAWIFKAKVFVYDLQHQDSASLNNVADVTSAAQGGDTRAQYLLGSYYANGLGVPKDFAKACTWFLKSAQGGNAEAQAEIGAAYVGGVTGFEQNFAEGIKWLRKAVAQENASAKTVLGFCYAEGKGLPQDFYLAVKWYREAAEQGDSAGQEQLAHSYRLGWGVDKDYTEAARWYRLAAEQGSPASQASLGVYVLDGPRGAAELRGGGKMVLKSRRTRRAFWTIWHRCLLPVRSGCAKGFCRGVQVDEFGSRQRGGNCNQNARRPKEADDP
jgi:TPR repeat protein